MWTYQLLCALACFVLTTKAAKVNPPANGRDFHVYSKSSSYDGLDTCEIKVNGGGNICKKGRGHNVVVVDPITLEYDSVSFDTYGDHTAPGRMVEYLKGVKEHSLIVMAIRDSTYSYYWSTEQLNYMDSFGSETVRDKWGFTYPQSPCPVSAGRYAWILLTQKRLMLRKNFRRLPKWVTCQSQPHTYGWSFLDKTFRLTIPCSVKELYGYCWHKGNPLLMQTSYHGQLKRPVVNDLVCSSETNCHVTYKCIEKYSVSADVNTNYCGWNGSWPANYKCPKCVSIFGLEGREYYDDAELVPGPSKIVKIELTASRTPSKDLFFVVKYNKVRLQTYNPNLDKFIGPFEVFKNFPTKRYDVKRESLDGITIGVYKNGTKFTVWMKFDNATMRLNNDKFTLQVVDFNSQNGFLNPFVLHELTKTIKMYDPCAIKRWCHPAAICVPVTKYSLTCQMNYELALKHDFCSDVDVKCRSDRKCRKINKSPYFECGCLDNQYGEHCNITIRQLSSNEVFNHRISFHQNSTLKNANFSHIQNMKLKFNKLYTKDEENGIYMLQNTSVEFTVQFLNTTNNRSAPVLIKSVPVNYFIFYSQHEKEFTNCLTRVPTKFYSDEIENSFTQEENDGTSSISKLVCQAVLRATKPDPCSEKCRGKTCSYTKDFPFFKCKE